jgi:alpha-N-arabinofuranosidase
MKYVINAHNKMSVISKEIYGHFSEHLGRCIYDGLYVGEGSAIPNTEGMRNDIVEALRAMKIPVLRWPGGCFADEYHWKDGIGPKALRKKMVNTHWGGVVEDNSFGTHEFMRLCELLDCEPYINGNLGSGTVQEMQEWVEYVTFDGSSPMSELRRENGREKPWRLKYFAVGNENWGCGGNMRPEYYADEYRRYATYLRNFDGNKLYKIACGANSADYRWTDVVMDIVGPRRMQGLSLHYYTVPRLWSGKGSATDFTTKEYYETLKKANHIEELVTRHSKIMDKYDPDKSVGLLVDEWGTWYDVEPGTNPGFLYQQNTMRDALVAGLSLNIFNKHSDRVKMANIAQLINVLQAVILTQGEKMLLTPTYHVFKMYAPHQNNTLLESWIENRQVGEEDSVGPLLSESASIGEDGSLVVTLCNLSLGEEVSVEAETPGFTAQGVTAEILTGAKDAKNTFEDGKAGVVKAEGYSKAAVTKNGFSVTLPPVSVVTLVLR